MYFAMQDLKPLDPEIQSAFLWVMGFFAVVLFGLIVFWLITVFLDYSKKRKQQLREARDSIWFDHNDSVLHCGLNKVRIEPSSLEHYVCKISFKSPSKYHSDTDIFYAKDHANDLGRGVEQAVRRLNKKAKALGLQNDLFKRGKDNTSVNDEYRQNIIND